MYSVVGCGECSALWIVADHPERSECPKCNRSRRFDARRKFVTTEDPDHAREVRARLLAAQADQEDAFAAVDSFAELEASVDNAGVDSDTYLEAMGVDPDEVASAGDADSTDSRNRTGVVRDAIRTLEEPTAESIAEYAADRGVPPEATEEILAKLHRSGAVSLTEDRYRLL